MLTSKQKREIEFFSQVWPDVPFTPTEQEIEEYFNITVHGKGLFDTRSGSRLTQEKRNWEIMLKMWKKDMWTLLFPWELLEERWGKHPFGDKAIRKISGKYV